MISRPAPSGLLHRRALLAAGGAAGLFALSPGGAFARTAGPLGEPAAASFRLTIAGLEALLFANEFTPRPLARGYRDEDHLLFALRGCRLAGGQAAGVIEDEVDLVLTEPDAHRLCCVVGVWVRRARNGPTGILVVPGSTVPNATSIGIQRRANEAERAVRYANLLPYGRYGLVVGPHGYYDVPGHPSTIAGAFLMRERTGVSSRVPVWRGFGGSGPVGWDVCQPDDNLHPAQTPLLSKREWASGIRFSSRGCVTVAEVADVLDTRSVGKGACWTSVRAACGLGPASLHDLSAYRSLCLLPAREAALAAVGACSADGFALKFGAEGRRTAALRADLALKSAAPDQQRYDVATHRAMAVAGRLARDMPAVFQ